MRLKDRKREHEEQAAQNANTRSCRAPVREYSPKIVQFDGELKCASVTAGMNEPTPPAAAMKSEKHARVIMKSGKPPAATSNPRKDSSAHSASRR